MIPYGRTDELGVIKNRPSLEPRIIFKLTLKSQVQTGTIWRDLTITTEAMPILCAVGEIRKVLKAVVKYLDSSFFNIP